MTKKLTIAVPASVVSDTPHLREKTAKIGYIGRAAAIFRVREIVVYADDPKANQRRDIDLVTLLLSYLETPQYLRKRLFQLKPELQYAGILPPLRTPHHPNQGRIRELKVGEYREGVVLSQAKEGVLVDIGVEQPALLRASDLAVNQRVTVQLVNVSQTRPEVQLVERDEVPEYWGYIVKAEPDSLKRVLCDSRFDLKIGTSRVAPPLQDVSLRLRGKWARSDRVLLAFGSPSRGLHEIAAEEGFRLEDAVDFVVNTLPGQGTETVRTEEAVLATLAVLNMQFGF
ncbi:MAG: putative RNA uridine N3 methyltransferase [Candidatus Bathyarchaeia archaeon]